MASGKEKLQENVQVRTNVQASRPALSLFLPSRFHVFWLKDRVGRKEIQMCAFICACICMCACAYLHACVYVGMSGGR